MSRELKLRHAHEDVSVHVPESASAQDSQRMRYAFCFALYGLLCALWFVQLPDPRHPAQRNSRPAVAPPRAMLAPPVEMPLRKPPTQALRARAAVHADNAVAPIGPVIEPLAIATELSPVDEEDWLIEPPEAPSPTDDVLIAGTPGVREPVFTRRVQPMYPPQGAAMRLQGYVILQAILRRDGTVDAIEVLRGLGKGKFGFEREAISSLRKWRFIPGSYNGQPADVRMNLRVDFVLN